MVRRILAIAFIFACSTVAWMVLGGTVFARTYNTDTRLRGRVASTWGTEHTQRAPTASAVRVDVKKVESLEDGKKIVRSVEERTEVALPLERSRVDVALDLDHRQKGLLWYSTYTVGFGGDYTFRNTTPVDSVTFTLSFPSAQAIYDDLVLTVDGQPVPAANGTAAVATVKVAPGATATLGVRYKSQGLEKWMYHFGDNVSQVRDFEMTMRTDFDEIDFADNTLSPTAKTKAGDGWRLTWRYNNLLSGYDIGMVMPEKLQPGPLAGRISFFAPVSLLFFFLLMFILTTIRGVELHPMNYFFLAAAFFAFHLLLAYLVDHVDVHVAFVLASITSVVLVLSYLRLVVGLPFALRYAAPAQVTYLVLFSYAFFFEGYTGLTVTVGSILTLFAVMQMTGRVRWAELFAERSGLIPAPDPRPRVAGKPA
ncbi:MAG TPA: inner membrane CreD family protein [Gemmatimonadaceae bacterium]|nr:inner membrane CreD family protein [Gemmatimonadaceae bacterium]